MSIFQPGILAPLSPLGRQMKFRLLAETDPSECLSTLAEVALEQDVVVGLGPCVAARLEKVVPGLREPHSFAGSAHPVPVLPGALWIWLRGADRGELFHRGRRLQRLLSEAFTLESALDTFVYNGGRDLTGYEDGTENPEGEKAEHTAFVLGAPEPGLSGSSFVAVQQWAHDLSRFENFSPSQQDAIIGRNRISNEELTSPPPSAHVVRTAQESFEPEAFLLRRSMPWAGAHGAGLQFVAFASSFDPFERQLTRMLGLEDGITDGLFRFSRVMSTAYYWCPPTHGDTLDLRALGL